MIILVDAEFQMVLGAPLSVILAYIADVHQIPGRILVGVMLKIPVQHLFRELALTSYPGHETSVILGEIKEQFRRIPLHRITDSRPGPYDKSGIRI